MKLTRRRLLYGSIGVVTVAAGGGYAWKERRILRVPHGWVGYTEKPELPLFPCEPGELAEADKEVLWDFFTALGRIWGMDAGNKASFVRLLDLKTKIAPSYLAEYQGAVKRFTELEKTAGTPEKAARAMLVPPGGAGEAAEHARVHVAGELVVKLLVNGGFKKFGLGKWRGWSGGPNGYRQSQRPLPRHR